MRRIGNEYDTGEGLRRDGSYTEVKVVVTMEDTSPQGHK